MTREERLEKALRRLTTHAPNYLWGKTGTADLFCVHCGAKQTNDPSEKQHFDSCPVVEALEALSAFEYEGETYCKACAEKIGAHAEHCRFKEKNNTDQAAEEDTWDKPTHPTSLRDMKEIIEKMDAFKKPDTEIEKPIAQISDLNALKRILENYVREAETFSEEHITEYAGSRLIDITVEQVEKALGVLFLGETKGDL